MLKVNNVYVVNYDAESKSWTTLLSKISKVPEITNECSEAFKKLSGLNIQNCQDFDALAKSVGYTDKMFVDFLKDTSYSEKTLDNYQKYLQSVSKSTAKFSAALKSMAVNIGIQLLINTVIRVFTELSQVEEEVAQKAQELGESFKSTKTEIEDYKTQIEELYKTINDSGSSISEVTTARQTLMSVQDELIDKFGDEKENIDLVTKAIEGQTSSLDTLIQKQYQASKNKFNESDGWNDFMNWRDGYSNNIDRMEDEMENAWANLTFLTKDYNSGEYDDIIKRLEKDGWKYSYSSERFIKGGSTEDLYEEILKLQEVFGEDIPDKFFNSLTKQANEFKNTLDSYEDMWDSYVLNDKIFKDEGLANNWKEVNDAYTKYQNAVDSGNTTAIEESMVGFATSINKVLDDENVSDGVKDYFKDMYPVLYREVEQWEFKTQVIPKFDTKGLQGKTQADVLEMLQTKGVQEGEKTFNSIVEKAIEYGLIIDDDKDSIQQLLDLLVEWEILQGTISDTAEEDNKIDVSLDSYKKASEGISSLSTAFKELTDSEYVSLDTISKIKEAVGDSVSNWDVYEQKLLSVKKGTAEYNQLMRELTYATLEKQLGGVNALANADEKYVAQLLKENGVLNANEVAHGAVERAKAKEWVQAQDNNDISEDTIASLIQEANAAGISTNAYLELTAKEILFNNNELDTSQKCQQILAIANAAGIASTAYSTLTNQINEWKSAKLGSGTRTKTATDLGMTVINEKNRGKDGKGKGNLYVASDGKQFEDYEDAMYYQESLNNVSRISNAYSNTNFVLPDYSGVKTGTSKDTKETFDWIETKISRLQRIITNFGKTVSATWKSWTDRNNALKSQISAVTQEINLQANAANKYLSLANSVGLGEGYKSLVRNGTLDISTITDENTINAIKQYKEYYEAYLSALDAKQDAENELAKLVREDFDMIAKQFDSEISLIEANISTLESYIDQTEMKGNLVSKNYYSAMYAEEEKNLSLLQQKYDQLSNKLSNGTITQGSEEFNEMATEIKEVSKAIIESKTALEEYQKTMRELDWEVFDLIQDKIGNVVNESNDWIDLLSNSRLFNDDGSITSQGQTTLGLHVANMKIYESQVKDYAQAIADLDKEFANDSLDKNYLERRAELVDLQRDLILQTQEERNSIKDLMSQGYDNLLSYMDELIAKRKSLLSQASDIRSFQKTVREQTDEISRLQNIINSYNGDLSEESKSAIQKYEVQLKEAESNLEDTLYDQYISDQEKMLDTLADDTNQWVNERLDNIDGLIEDVIESTDANAETIKTTLETEVSAVGGSLTTEMQNLWSGADGIKGVVGGVNNTLLEIKNLVQSMVKSSDTEANKNASGATANITPNTSKPATTTSTPSTNNSSTSSKSITVGGMINASGALIYDYAGDTSGERQYYRNSPYYRVLSEKNGYLKVRHQSLSSGTTGWFKKSDVKAYKTGGLVDETGLAWLDGTKGKPEMVLSAKDTENFLQLKDALKTVAQTNLFENIQSYAKLPNFVPNATNNNQQAMIIQGDIVLEGVQSPEDLARKMKEIYQGDVSHVRKTIRADVYGGMLGKNSLTRYKY